MPYSHFNQLDDVNRLIILSNPKTILDIGVGFGTYGFLSRQFLDIADGRNDYGNWLRTIDGIEVFDRYLTPVHKFIYNQIFIGNACDIVPRLKKQYDLVLLVDVIEHLQEDRGKKLLLDCVKKGRNLIIATPKDIGGQGAVFGNQFETHRCQWQAKDFDMFSDKFFVKHPDAFIVFIGKDAEMMKHKWLKEKQKFFLRKFSPHLYNFLWQTRDKVFGRKNRPQSF